jgi:hypothetical protein
MMEALCTVWVVLSTNTVLARLTLRSLWAMAMAAEMALPTTIAATAAHDASFRAIVVVLPAKLQASVAVSTASMIHATHMTHVFIVTPTATMLLLLKIMHALLQIVKSVVHSVRTISVPISISDPFVLISAIRHHFSQHIIF